MVHHRLGHASEARRWLDQVLRGAPRDDPRRAPGFGRMMTAVLREEAEAMILDAGFPADPFARSSILDGLPGQSLLVSRVSGRVAGSERQR